MCSQPDRKSRGNTCEACCPFFLPQRQTQVLELAAQGLTATGIARQLIITPRTVRKHLTTARESFNASNTTQAVVIAYALGLIRL